MRIIDALSMTALLSGCGGWFGPRLCAMNSDCDEWVKAFSLRDVGEGLVLCELPGQCPDTRVLYYSVVIDDESFFGEAEMGYDGASYLLGREIWIGLVPESSKCNAAAQILLGIDDYSPSEYYSEVLLQPWNEEVLSVWNGGEISLITTGDGCWESDYL